MVNQNDVTKCYENIGIYNDKNTLSSFSNAKNTYYEPRTIVYKKTLNNQTKKTIKWLPIKARIIKRIGNFSLSSRE